MKIDDVVRVGKKRKSDVFKIRDQCRYPPNEKNELKRQKKRDFDRIYGQAIGSIISQAFYNKSCRIQKILKCLKK